jgi:hypothetical protein
MAKTTPVEFLRQVRQMVFVMVFLAAIFFYLVDLGLYNGVRWLLSLGGGV